MPCAHLVGHAVCQQHGVPVVDAHAVAAHRVLDLLHDLPARCLNAQAALHLSNVVGAGVVAAHAQRPHHSLQPRALHEQVVAVVLVLVDDSALDSRDAHHNDLQVAQTHAQQQHSRRLGKNAGLYLGHHTLQCTTACAYPVYCFLLLRVAHGV
jgi:hypothetical protein